jgi:rRNA processing protein Gar1
LNLGKVIGVSKTKHIILHAIDWQAIKTPPKIGDVVYTKKKRKIGKIHDIFGPAVKPFISVKLYSTNDSKLEYFQKNTGSFLYTFSDTHKETRKSRSGRVRKSKGSRFRRIS